MRREKLIKDLLRGLKSAKITQESFLDLRVEDVDEASVQNDLRRVSEDAAAARHAGLPDRGVGVPQGRLDG